jgi:hypothetical protein
MSRTDSKFTFRGLSLLTIAVTVAAYATIVRPAAAGEEAYVAECFEKDMTGYCKGNFLAFRIHPEGDAFASFTHEDTENLGDWFRARLGGRSYLCGRYHQGTDPAQDDLWKMAMSHQGYFEIHWKKVQWSIGVYSSYCTKLKLSNGSQYSEF